MSVQAPSRGNPVPQGLGRGEGQNGLREGVGRGNATGGRKIDLSELAVEDDKLLTPAEQKEQKKSNREALNLALINGGISSDFLLDRAAAYAESDEVGQAFDGLVLDELRELYGKGDGAAAPSQDEGATPSGAKPADSAKPADGARPADSARPAGGTRSGQTAADPDGYLYGKDGKPNPDEVVQYAVGDCYFFAAAMALAETDPQSIQKLIKPNGDGSYTVTLYQTEGKPPKPVMGPDGKPKTVDIQVTREEVEQATAMGGARPGGAASGGAHWAQVLEVAYAKYFCPQDLQRGLKAIEGGFTQDAFANLTGNTAKVIPLNGAGLKELDDLLKKANNGGMPLTFHAFPEVGDGGIDPTTGARVDGAAANQDGLLDGHAYQVVSFERDEKGEIWVTLRNSMGKDVPTGPDGKPVAADGKAPDGNPADGLVRFKLSDLLKNPRNELVLGTPPGGSTSGAPADRSAAGGRAPAATPTPTPSATPTPTPAPTRSASRSPEPASDPLRWGAMVPHRIAELFSNYRAA